MSHRRRPRPSHAANPEARPVRSPLASPAAPPTRLQFVDIAIGICLIAATVPVYAQVRTHGFPTCDAPEYVTANAHGTAGLTAAGFGVMAKSMIVTLPFVLPLLGRWPLGRWRAASGCRRTAVAP